MSLAGLRFSSDSAPRPSEEAAGTRPLSPILVWARNGPIQGIIWTIGISWIVEVVRTGIGSCDAHPGVCAATTSRIRCGAGTALRRSAGTGCACPSACTLGSRGGAQGEHRNQHNGKQRCSRHAILHHAPATATHHQIRRSARSRSRPGTRPQWRHLPRVGGGSETK